MSSPFFFFMPRRQQRFEEVAGQRLPLGGVNGYRGVRGKQGKKKNKYQGTTPKKKHRTKLFDEPREAAIAFAQLREDLELGMLEERGQKKAKSPKTTAATKKVDYGVYLGHLLQQPQPVVPTVPSVLLLPHQSAAAAARGVAVAFADPLP